MRARPRLFVSRCLGFESCRYNGQTFPDPYPGEPVEVSDSGKGRDHRFSVIEL